MTLVELVDPADTRELRQAVMRPWLEPGAPMVGDDLPDAVHLGAVVDGRVVSTCFVVPEPCPWILEASAAWRLRSMASWPEARGRGYAGEVLVAAIGYVTDQGADLLWCNARVPAIRLYERHGFAVSGEVFPGEHEIPHRRMARWITHAR